MNELDSGCNASHDGGGGGGGSALPKIKDAACLFYIPRKNKRTQNPVTYGLNYHRGSSHISAQIMTLRYFRSIEPIPIVIMKEVK